MSGLDDSGRSRWARLRADLRLARRQVWRSRGSSALVASLIALPMALVSGGIVFGFGHVPTTDETLTAELGQSQAWVAVWGGPDPSARQYFDYPTWVEIDRRDSGEPVNTVQPLRDDAADLVPAGALEIGTASVTAQTRTGIAPMAGVVGPAGDASLRGRFELLAGTAASGPGEAMVSPGALERLGAAVGDELVLTDPAATLKITGVLKKAENPDATATVFLPGADPFRALQADITQTRWYLPEAGLTASEVDALNVQGLVALDRALYTDPGDRSAPVYGQDGVAWSIGALVAAVAVFCAYLVILLAGAAFSVSARRQQRALAVAASVGAGRRDVFRIVLLQGTVLGLAGGAVGAAAGIGLGVLFLQLLDDGAVGSYWGLHLPWGALAGVVAFAVAVGTLAAVAPARAATKGEVIAALRGARRPVRVRTSRPLWGTLFMVVGVAVTAVCGLALATLTSGVNVDWSHPLLTVCVIGVVSGPLLLQLGVILAGHWLLTQVARPLARIGLAPRIASRDAAAHPGRVVPAFAAIAAVAFLASAALSGVAASMGASERGWFYQAPVGTVALSGYWIGDGPATPEGLAAGERKGESMLARTEPERTATVRTADVPMRYDESGTLVNPQDTFVAPQLQQFVPCDDETGGPARCVAVTDAAWGKAQAMGIVEPDDLDLVIGRSVPDAVRTAFDEGAAVVIDSDFLDADGAVVLNRYRVGDVESFFSSPGNAPPRALGTEAIATVAVPVSTPPPWRVLVSPDRAAELGLVPVAWTTVAAYPQTAVATDVDALRADLDNMWRTDAEYSMWVALEQGPPDTAPWLWLILGATATLVVGASGVALGLARVERRPDDATLAAVGGSRGLRRGIAFWQAAIIAGMGALTGAAAGILPVWGVILASSASWSPPTLSDLPWPWLLLLGVGLPLAIAVVSWAVPPRDPDLTRRTAIA
ncbi:hypothetical protein N3K63_13675 [Microbacterium sp. W1N]|uniref:FtsX-like permease family protein n=1 Tax=Microbacterium festucae TaxID=2977531 RepID=UPI0021BDFA1C|nr:FtsX-like permease family protein [Microbacterium festucae]MCT9821330.1 hypothetical protein [Microbacterium festucae]